MLRAGLLAGLMVATAGGPADLVIENARIWSDGLGGFAEYAAVRDGRFILVGGRPGGDELVGPATQVIDAGGRLVIPGLIDTHIHMLSGGLQIARLSLGDAESREDFVERIDTWTRGLEPGRWILGGRWTTEGWPDPSQPTRAWVDEVSGDHPLLLTRMDGHSALANSRALAIAGITAGGPADPAGGVIDRDPATGEPTGMLRDSAIELVARHVPPVTVDQQVAALQHAAGMAVRDGITAVGDILSIEDLPAYRRLCDIDLPVRFYLYVTAPDWSQAAGPVRAFPDRPGHVEVRGFKAYVDGSLGSRTAWMREPYLGGQSGRPQWRGLLQEGVEDGQLAGNLAFARDAGMQAMVHAIGDEANHLLLDTMQQVYGGALPSARCRVEHAQHLLPQDVARFGELGVIASMQPYHKADDGRYAESYIGPYRARFSYMYRSLLDAGAVVAFGSDWPVVTFHPFLGIETAVTGRTLDGRIWQPQESITVPEALRCYTSRAAWALFAESEIGRIAPGCRADFVILEGSPFEAVTSDDWAKIRTHMVFVEGRAVYPQHIRRPAPGPPAPQPGAGQR